MAGRNILIKGIVNGEAIWLHGLVPVKQDNMADFVGRKGLYEGL